MLQSHSHHLVTPNFPISLSHHHYHIHNPSLFSSPLINFTHRPTTLPSVSAHDSRARPEPPSLAQVPDPEPTTTDDAPEEGPVEIPFTFPSIFATTDDPTPLQTATSVLLTGAITVFLFRSLRRRARRAKELKFRSSGVKKSLKEEAVDTLKAMGSASIESNTPPSPIQALLGGLSAGVIALILYKFSTTVEASLNRQTISDSFSIRQITITIRTIVNGLCYLATFIFGINSVGLVLYSGQLAINSLMEGSTNKEIQSKGDEQLSSPNSMAESTTDSSEVSSTKEDQSSNDTQ